jgi:hypothetical protein
MAMFRQQGKDAAPMSAEDLAKRKAAFRVARLILAKL